MQLLAWLPGWLSIVLWVSFTIGCNIEVLSPPCGNSELNISLDVVAKRCLYVFNRVSYQTFSFQSKLLYTIVSWLQFATAVVLILFYKEVTITLHCKAWDASRHNYPLDTLNILSAYKAQDTSFKLSDVRAYTLPTSSSSFYIFVRVVQDTVIPSLWRTAIHLCFTPIL